MTPDDYGKITFMVINQKGMTAQARLDLIYKISLLMGGMERYNPDNLKVVLTKEQTILESTQNIETPDFAHRIHGKESVESS